MSEATQSKNDKYFVFYLYMGAILKAFGMHAKICINTKNQYQIRD